MEKFILAKRPYKYKQCDKSVVGKFRINVMVRKVRFNVCFIIARKEDVI